ncbi:hypothetical protein MYX04_13530 [Nitrospiraceae bacterium AH_259_D15_M11_P09]|nr:hypothetical protein [Nitrospiraceae bacterium AH_259_D15_M11_P09]
MRKVIALGAVILLAGGVNLAIAQERLPQHSGFGTGVGESAGTGSRSQIWDKSALLERLDQPETIIGRVFAIDFAQGRFMIETGGIALGGGGGYCSRHCRFRRKYRPDAVSYPRLQYCNDQDAQRRR